MNGRNPPDRLQQTLDVLSEVLRWPSWEHDGAVGHSVARWPDVPEALKRAGDARHGGSYIRIFGPSALETASHQVEDQDPRPLAGLPIAVKDLIAVAGQPIGAGSQVRAEASPEPAHAAIVDRLLGLGAVVVGIVTLHEFAFGVTGINDHTGFPRNPNDRSRIPGGSSSGSAVAVAEGSAGLAIGTDTGGSLRIPAALCGVVGFKPAYGQYPTAGVFPLAPSLDHVGFVAPSMDVVVAAHTALGHQGPSGGPLRCVGIVEDDLEEADPEVSARVEQGLALLRDRGVDIVSVAWPSAERSFATSTAIMFSEASALHRRDLDLARERYGTDVRRRLEVGFAIDAPTYVAAMRERTTLRSEVGDVLRDVDAVVTPTVPMVAPRVEDARDPDVSARLVRNTRLGNVVGFPAASLPLPVETLPVGLQLLSRDEPTLLRSAVAIETFLRQGT